MNEAVDRIPGGFPKVTPLPMAPLPYYLERMAYKGIEYLLYKGDIKPVKSVFIIYDKKLKCDN